MAPGIGKERLLEEALAQVYASPPSWEELRRQADEAPLPQEGSARQPLRWRNIFLIALVHILGLPGFVFGLPHIKATSLLFIASYGAAGAIGITAGAHRLWSHRSYKAKWPLRLILAAFFSMGGLTTIYDWVRDHRLHHKFSETHADPHNATRGLFFSHCGWIMQAKHPMIKQQGKKLDLSDIKRDWVVHFYDKHYLLYKTFFCFILPTLVLRNVFGEPWWLSVGANLARYMITLNGVWVVNSLAHKFGSHPYDKNIRPAENLFVTMYAFGEGWHNFHHSFPWDYSSSEYGLRKNNLTMLFIDLFALVGWAYDRKTVSIESVKRHASKAGDGSRTI